MTCLCNSLKLHTIFYKGQQLEQSNMEMFLGHERKFNYQYQNLLYFKTRFFSVLMHWKSDLVYFL